MTGFPGWHDNYEEGWFEVNTEGLATIYLTITDEGIVTLTSDTPSAKVFDSRISNPEQISIKQMPVVWPHGDTSVQMAAIGQIDIDNVDGLYTFLCGADLRDAQVVIKLAPALALGTATMIADAPTMVTAIFDNATANEDTVTLTLKDALTALDRPLPVRYNPPFVDSGAANRMVPITLGACRNVAPLLIDGPNRIYQIGDGPMTNVTAARDGGANLDPHATPPQYVPALSGSGIQLQTDTVNKFTVDASSVGQQVVIPGDVDVLGGIGDFSTSPWTGSPAHPVGWSWSNNPGSLLRELGSADGYFGFEGIAYMQSALSWFPEGAQYGDYLVSDSAWLTAGKAYRLNAHIYSTFSAAPFFTTGLVGGIMFRSALSDNAEDAISPHGQPLTVPSFGRYSYTFDFRCPAGSDRPIYLLCNTAQGGPNEGLSNGLGGGLVYQITLEELGEYVELPLAGISLEQFFFEWLVNRDGQDESSYSQDDLAAIDAATGYEIGYHVTEQPNVLDGLRSACDSYCATLFTDHLGTVRISRLIDPKDGTPIADFVATTASISGNIDGQISIVADDAPNLTTLIGTTRNWDPLTDSDFVTDTDTVPAEVRTRFKQISQYQRTSSKSPAGQYNFAIGAPVFHSLLDDPANGQTEIDRVVGIWSPRVYNDGTVSTGKRRIATVPIKYDSYDRVGYTQFCDVRDLVYGAVVTLTHTAMGFDSTPVEIIGWEVFPFSNRATLTVLY